MQLHVSYCLHVESRGKAVGLCFLLPSYESRVLTQVVRLTWQGPSSSMSHLSGLRYLDFMGIMILYSKGVIQWETQLHQPDDLISIPRAHIKI